MLNNPMVAIVNINAFAKFGENPYWARLVMCRKGQSKVMQIESLR